MVVGGYGDTGSAQDTAGNVVWANDNRSLFYVTKDNLDRPCKVWRYTLGADKAEGTHQLVFHEVRPSPPPPSPPPHHHRHHHHPGDL